MPDLANMPERILDWDKLLAPIPGDNPSGRSMRYEPVYDAIRDGIKPAAAPPPGAVVTASKGIDYRPVIRDASNLLARDSKDLDVAVWLTEALVGNYGFSALAEGVELIQALLDAFWPTLYPNVDDDGDEGFRAKPVARLNQAFAPVILQLQITSDPRSPVQYTMSQYSASREVPSAERAANSSEQQEKREKALAEGACSPEAIDQAIEATRTEFYLELAEDVKRTSAAVEQLQQSCNRLFQTDDRPYLEKFSNQLEGMYNTLEGFAASKAPAAPAPAAAYQAPEPDSSSPAAESYAAPSAAAAAAAPAPAPAAEPVPPQGIPALAAAMRQEDSSDPVPYMLLRSWRFGPMIARGAVDESYLEAPSTELRTALRRAVLNADWWEVLVQTEAAMEQESGRSWLDIQLHTHRAATELGLTGIAAAVRGMLSVYLQVLPDLPAALMLDGSPAASAETLAWLRKDVLVDPGQARKESLDEVRAIDPEEHPDVFEGKPPDAFEIAETELAAGRFAEAFRVLSEAIAAETSGRGRAQRKVQLAKICVEAQQYRIALPILRELCRFMEELRLDAWEPKEFAAAPLAMLYTCLAKLGENPEEQQRAYDRLCSLHPMKALELAGGA